MKSPHLSSALALPDGSIINWQGMIVRAAHRAVLGGVIPPQVFRLLYHEETRRNAELPTMDTDGLYAAIRKFLL